MNTINFQLIKQRIAFILCWIFTVIIIITMIPNRSYAKSPNEKKLSSLYQEKKVKNIRLNKNRAQWERQRFEKLPIKKIMPPSKPPAQHFIELQNFPAPPTDKEKDDRSALSTVTDLLAWLFLPTTVHAADIIIDGKLDDWSINDQINLPLNLPPDLALGDVIYARYIATPTPMYMIALKSTDATIGVNTTFWLNTDQDANTGYQVWGDYGGAEYFINMYIDSAPHLYNSDFQWVSALNYAYNPDHSVIEIAIPVAFLSPLIPPQAINLLADINNTLFLFPDDWSQGGQYTIVATPTELPPRTDFSKHIGIVYCEASKDNFFNEKTYSQLFMSLQHQAMMAGINFTPISENELTNIANIVNYDALVFSYCANIKSAQLSQIHETLYNAIYHYGIGMITADNWLTADEYGVAIVGDSYRNMKQLLGITRINGEGPVDISVSAMDTSHYLMRDYTTNETIINYQANWYSYYDGVMGQAVSYLAEQTVTGVSSGTYPAILATETGGRNVHFSSVGLLGDSNLVWQAIQWVVYGDLKPVGLNMGRDESLFISRVDMDQSQIQDEVALVEVPLLSMLEDWKNRYNYVVSSYINVGNNPSHGDYTNWQVSAPLYQNYMALGNEIGTHSYTHPDFTDSLSANDIKFEFNSSINEIIDQLTSTWRNQVIRGGAVPGAPEKTTTAVEINQWLDYLTGGFSSFGAGYPGAHGFLTPDESNFYLSPNMSFDFTLLFFGVPTGNPAVPVILTPEQAVQHWKDEYLALSQHANQPIIVWPWHDYCPTEWEPGCRYEMFEKTIKMAFNHQAEFVTAADVNQRLHAFKRATLHVSHDNNLITVDVNMTGNHHDLSTFSLSIETDKHNGEMISRVDDWYAYDENSVFIDRDGGKFNVRLGTSIEAITHISKLPMRAKLISLEGNGTKIAFNFEGEGTVQVTLSEDPANFNISGADNILLRGNNVVEMKYNSYGEHQGEILLK